MGIRDSPEPVGRLPVTHHSHEEIYSMPTTFKGVKNVDFKYYLMYQPAIFYAMGMCSQEKIKVDVYKRQDGNRIVGQYQQQCEAYDTEPGSECSRRASQWSLEIRFLLTQSQEGPETDDVALDLVV